MAECDISLRKFTRRHKALVASSPAIFVVLIIGIIGRAWEARVARRAEQTALHERDRAAAAEPHATKERDRVMCPGAGGSAERNRAVAAKALAIGERNRTVAEKQGADTESSTARAINDFQENDLLAQASTSVQARPQAKADPDLKMRTASGEGGPAHRRHIR
jgi:hypothetical protein